MMSCTRKRSLSQIFLANPEVMFEESGPKSGKWSAEEEMYANKLIAQFEAGTLTDCAEGSTLRSYLARKLNCAPMRISKKFAGQCIGKHTFTKKEPCVIPAMDREPQPEPSMVATVPSLDNDSLDLIWDDAIDIMSFDAFTEFQGRQESYGAPSSSFAPVGMWANAVEVIPQSAAYPPLKRQMVVAPESYCSSEDVGLDLDNMYSNCSTTKVVPVEYEQVAAPSVPAPAAELPMKKDWGLRCTIPQYQYRPPSPSVMVPSGAAVVTPTHASEGSPVPAKPVTGSAFVPCPAPEQPQCQKYEPCLQLDACTQTSYCDTGDLEAAEWRDVLDYFCGPQALYC